LRLSVLRHIDKAQMPHKMAMKTTMILSPRVWGVV